MERIYDASWNRIGRWVAIPVLVVQTALFGWITKWIGNLLLPTICNPAHCVLRPDEYAWVFPGALLGFGLVPWSMVRINRYYLQRRYNRDGRHLEFPLRDLEGGTLVKPVIWIFFALALFVTVAIRDNYVIIHNDTIRINPLTSFREGRFRTADLKLVERKEFTGRRAGDVEYRLVFASGYEYKSRDNLLPEGDVFHRLAAQAGIRVDTVVEHTSSK